MNFLFRDSDQGQCGMIKKGVITQTIEHDISILIYL